MRFAVLAISLLLGLFCLPAFADPAAIPSAPGQPAPDPAKMAAAERYFLTQDFDADVNGLVNGIGQSIRNPAITPEQKTQFVDFARAHLDQAMLKQSLINAMAQTYTTNELNALADFYGSPAGKSVATKSMAFQRAVNMATIPVALNFVSAYTKECTDKSKCLDLSLLVPPVAPQK